MARILVTAATGRVGSELAQRLIAAGHDVSAVTSRPENADALRDAGATPVIADLQEPETFRQPAEGMDAIFLATPDDPRQDVMEGNLIALFAAAGKPHIVKLSAQSAGLDPPVSFGAYHRRSEEALEASGLPHTVLRPTFFQQSLLLFAQDVARKRKITAPVGKGRIAMVDVADVATAAEAVICSDRHFGETYTLTGPSAHSFDDIVGLLSDRLGHKIGFSSPPAFAARIVLPLVTGMPRWQSGLVVDLLSALKAGAQQETNGDVERLTGRPPRSIEDFITHNLHAFGG
ncbi:NAD(P)H-binding protein [Hoeflea poritis]|uniref:NAD(P)H-binding protein n=1 Tax=Hoeflea poritis TaxID=2993659 RepID=A0ABT4VIK9_9HYPH|nr:NAD(P)H-binding protein [Hoeflea poritis]MDA4844434.1 NAD(P)H-binding protein [Hoeflea poritis]